MLDLISQHADQQVGTHPFDQVMMDWAHLEHDRIHDSGGTLDDAQSLVGRYGFGGVESRFWQAAAGDTEVVESGLGRNAGVITGPGEDAEPNL